MDKRAQYHLTRGEKTRLAILEAAVSLASDAGLEALTIGRLADQLGMSKAGLFSHFGSKEQLQLATLEAARERVFDVLGERVHRAVPGVARVDSLLDGYLAYARGELGVSGGFFSAVGREYHARPGAIRDRVAAILRSFHALVAALVREAVERGDLRLDLDADQLAFELIALVEGAAASADLLGDPAVLSRARRAVDRRMRDARVDRPRASARRARG